MKKLILTIGIVVTGLTFTLAQEKTNAPALFDKINQVCQLSSEQKGKLQPAVFQYTEAQNENEKQFAGNPEGLKTANVAARNNFEDKLKSILTVVQLDAYTKSVNGESTDVTK